MDSVWSLSPPHRSFSPLPIQCLLNLLSLKSIGIQYLNYQSHGIICNCNLLDIYIKKISIFGNSVIVEHLTLSLPEGMQMTLKTHFLSLQQFVPLLRQYLSKGSVWSIIWYGVFPRLMGTGTMPCTCDLPRLFYLKLFCVFCTGLKYFPQMCVMITTHKFQEVPFGDLQRHLCSSLLSFPCITNSFHCGLPGLWTQSLQSREIAAFRVHPPHTAGYKFSPAVTLCPQEVSYHRVHQLDLFSLKN